MMLRVSTQADGKKGNLDAVTSGEAEASEVEHAAALLALTEAQLTADEEALSRARDDLHEALGPQAVADAAGVIGNFERMVRIADGSGIPLDGTLSFFTEDIRSELELDRFTSSANTKAVGPVQRMIRRVVAPSALKVANWLDQMKKKQEAFQRPLRKSGPLTYPELDTLKLLEKLHP